MGEGWYPKYGNHDVKIKLQWGRYKGEVFTSMGGNIAGASIINNIASSFEEGDITFKRTPENEKYIDFEDGERKYAYADCFKLFDGEDILRIDGHDKEEMKKIIVGIEIVNFQEEKF